MSSREEHLEKVLAQFIRPVKGIPFEVVVRGLCERRVFKYDSDAGHPSIKPLISAMNSVCKELQAAPIQRPRPNEVGNDIEDYLLRALVKNSISAERPKTLSGRGKSTGYPDLKLEIEGHTVFLEVKSYAEESHKTTFRSFYLSPSEDHKITEDGIHLVAGFEIVDLGNNGGVANNGRQLRDYAPTGFCIVDLFGMECDMKSEFNSDNRRMYEPSRILFETKLPID